MKVLSFPHGEVRFQDCMEGLAGLPDKSWDLCITDPPYGIEFTHCGSNTTEEFIESKTLFDDSDPGTAWFDEVKRVCDRAVFTCGYKNIRKWMAADDFDLVVWYNLVKQGECRVAKMIKWDPILCWNVGKPKKFKQGVINIPSESGCVMRKDAFISIHPCPKPIRLWNRIVDELRPESVLDPFLGSGTTAQTCESRGIKYLAFEIAEQYAGDIEKRAALGIRSFGSRLENGKQKALF